MDGMFHAKHTWWIHLYESGGETTSYENLGRLFRGLINIQAGRMTYLCEPVLYTRSVVEKTNVDKSPLSYIKKH